MKKKCIQCEGTKNLNKIEGTHSQYDGEYICDSCLDKNEASLTYDDFIGRRW